MKGPVFLKFILTINNNPELKFGRYFNKLLREILKNCPYFVEKFQSATRKVDF